MSAPSAKLLDLRTLGSAEREAVVLHDLESKPMGEPLQIVSDRKPEEILAALQRQWPSDFDWNVLEEGPPVWRIEVVHRAGDRFRGVMDYLGEDHRRLDGLLDDILQVTRRGPEACHGEGSKRFGEFRTGLQRHIREEEDIVFPVFERRTGMVGGAVLAMRQEHREIETILQRMHLRLQAGQPIDDLVEDMRGVMSSHCIKEEQVLYPMTDRHLDAAERAELIRKMQQV